MKIINQRRTAKIYLQPGDRVAYTDLDPKQRSENPFSSYLRLCVKINGTVYGKSIHAPMDMPSLKAHLAEKEITVEEVLPSDDIDLGKLQWEGYKL